MINKYALSQSHHIHSKAAKPITVTNDDNSSTTKIDFSRKIVGSALGTRIPHRRTKPIPRLGKSADCYAATKIGP